MVRSAALIGSRGPWPLLFVTLTLKRSEVVFFSYGTTRQRSVCAPKTSPFRRRPDSTNLSGRVFVPWGFFYIFIFFGGTRARAQRGQTSPLFSQQSGVPVRVPDGRSLSRPASALLSASARMMRCGAIFQRGSPTRWNADEAMMLKPEYFARTMLLPHFPPSSDVLDDALFQV